MRGICNELEAFDARGCDITEDCILRELEKVQVLPKFMVSTTLGAPVQQRDGTCRFRVGFARGQNPIAGGNNSLACISEVTYADGNKEQLSDECRYVMNDHCYPSGLPYRLCIHTNDNMKDGYIDYGANHVDFHDDGCKTESYASPSGEGTF
ncbi:hypothetical protein NHJ13734_007734 [Beauveria thailandica]